MHKLTLQLVFEELLEKLGEPYYSYSHFCRVYREWLGKQRLSMRQQHKGGVKLFVDYYGPTVPITCATTQEKRTAQIFVAVMGASNYTYAEATYSQQLEDWIMSQTFFLRYTHFTLAAIQHSYELFVFLLLSDLLGFL